jgi:hypothetical protein
MWFRAGCLFVLFLGAASASACYEYAPAPAAPGLGTRLLLELNDRGRVGLGDSIGPSSEVVEGTLASNSDSTYSLRVLRVGYLNGQSNEWKGEPLIVRRDFVGIARERKFSRGRTWLTATGISLAAVAFIGSRKLLGFGSSASQGGGPPPPTQ